MATSGADESGRVGESLAARFLRKKGYKVIRRNSRSPIGEIDLIMRDGDAVVFVEVKTRTSRKWGEPEEAVTREKQRKICREAMRFATRHRLGERPLRFDVVAVLLEENRDPEIRHYEAAFAMP